MLFEFQTLVKLAKAVYELLTIQFDIAKYLPHAILLSFSLCLDETNKEENKVGGT